MADPKLTPEVELFHRSKLKESIMEIQGTGSVFTVPEFFTSYQDFVDAVGHEVSAGDDLEVQFCQISWLGFEDSEDDPCEDNPAVKIIYRLHFFHQFEQKRLDGSNSHDTFTAMIINLRNKFLLSIVQAPNIEREPLKQDGYIITDDESEFFAGAYGHWCNLITKISID